MLGPRGWKDFTKELTFVSSPGTIIRFAQIQRQHSIPRSWNDICKGRETVRLAQPRVESR